MKSKDAAAVAVPGGFRYHGSTVLRATATGRWLIVREGHPSVQKRTLREAFDLIDSLREGTLPTQGEET